MTSLTFYGGVNEIGGNKVLLEDQDTRIFLDFGMSFGRRGDFFEEYLRPRSANGIGDFLEMGLIPELEGVYRGDLLKHLGREPKPTDIDAVLVSHAHADHVNYISFLHRDIPVHCGETALRILEAIDEQTGRDIESEVLHFKERPIVRGSPEIKRKFNTFRTGDKVKIGSLEIEPVHVDHSVPGAYGFVIHTSEGAVAYTGDLRLHGNRPEMTRDFIEKAQAAKPVAMVSEGTRIDIPEDKSSEKTVYATSSEVVKNANQLVLVDFNFKDVDRFRTFYKIAKETGRKLVISFKHACFLEKYHEDGQLNVPDSKDENIMILKPKRMTGTYNDSDYRDEYIKKRMNYPNIITAEELRKDQNKYIKILNFWYLNQLIDLQPAAGSTYIHAHSEPFNEEMEFSEKRLNNWLAHFKLEKVQSHCSGHACGAEIKELIEKISPKKLFPIHTEHPEMFKKLSMHTELVRNGKKYEV